MANQPSAPTAQPPPDVPAMTDVNDTLSQYLRRFSLWCRNGFADKLSATAALRGIPFLGYDAPAGPAPNVYQLEVSNAGVAGLAPVPLAGTPGAFTPIGTVGTKTNDNAPAGSIGEVISANITSPVTLTSPNAANVANVLLTAGDWDVYGEVWFSVGTGGATTIHAGVNTASAVIPTASALGTARATINASLTASLLEVLSLRPCRVSLAASATYYLIAQAAFPSGTMTATGNIWARRAR